ncbi:zinc finger protein ZFAT [Caerostris darwini]|uniref:Zinc finger protein ZFAT n=1 Tax=Caerostris darwini TaxID=1538125 RepID=A0AAV4UZ19_9ARAC|nr:zinc finger protein ZFAT [Caerostris darwini]
MGPLPYVFMENDSRFQNSMDCIPHYKTKIHSSLGNIYVCTFCQVFATSSSTVATHIASSHKASLPIGTNPENFVSRLQPLQKEKTKNHPRKGGRPRKKESSPVLKEKMPVAEPVPDADGLYRCQICHKHFRKSRQLSMHICLDIVTENDNSSESTDSKSASDYQMYMDVDPRPWLKRPEYKASFDGKLQNVSCLLAKELSDKIPSSIPEKGCDKTVFNWRNDPNYVQLFENETEREAFEKHVKSIDYSFVDQLFTEVESKNKRSQKQNDKSHITLYSCIVCRKEMHSITHIRMHCVTHTDAKPFTCPKCQYCTNAKGSLYTHMRLHTGNFFRCSKCDFKSLKRTHLLQHEQTHSTVAEICKLCKNSYKNRRSLTYHVQKYHKGAEGKRYHKFLSGRSSFCIKCNICRKIFRSQASYDAHNHQTIPAEASTDVSELKMQMISSDSKSSFNQPQLPSVSDSQYLSNIVTLKNSFDEIDLNYLLLPKNNESVKMYKDVFQQCSNQNLLMEAGSISNNFVVNQPQIISLNLQHSSEELPSLDAEFPTAGEVLNECEKTLNLDILNECMMDSNFANEVISETCNQSQNLANDCGSFGIPEIQLSYTNDSLIVSNENDNISKDLSHLNTELLGENNSSEQKSAETELFEKCRRAPAYVCCVCSGIFICPTTLKAHLKGHVKINNSNVEQLKEEFVQPNITETNTVCILQDSCYNKEDELEKLFNSSLDQIMYLPEVSVLLEKDPTILDFLDEFSNFPISEKLDETDELEMNDDLF